MISEETYNAVQAISRARARVPIYSKKKTTHFIGSYCVKFAMDQSLYAQVRTDQQRGYIASPTTMTTKRYNRRPKKIHPRSTYVIH